MNTAITEPKQKRKFSLSTKIIVATVVLSAIPLLIFAGSLRLVVLDNIHSLIIDQSKDNYLTFLNAYTKDAKDVAKILSEDTDLINAVANGNTSAIRVKLNSVYSVYSDFDVLEVGDANGTVLYRAHKPDRFGDNKADKLEFKNALRGTPQIGFYNEGGRGVLAYRILYPIKRSGEVVGTVMTGMDINEIIKKLYATEGTKFILYDTENKAVENNLEGYIISDSLKDKLNKGKTTKITEISSSDIYRDPSNNPWIYTIYPIYAPDGTYLGAYQLFSNASRLIKSENSIAIIAISIAAVGVITAILLAIYTANRLTAPVVTLREGLEKLNKGDRQVRIVIKSNDELEETANMLNKTLDEVLRYAQTDEEYKTLQKNIIELLEVSDALASGDFTKKARVGEGQLGIIADAFNTITISLRESLNRVKELSDDLTNKVEQSNEGLDAVTHNREMVVQQIADTQTKANTLSELSTQIADLSAILEGSFVIEAEKTRKSSMALAYSTEKIVGIKDSIQDNNKKIKKLGEDMLQIANQIVSIQEITKKTNLVAINTAIEANAMGDAGKNFASVAVEIKKMAASNEESSKIIKEAADSMLKVIQQLTASMENSITELTISTNDTLGSIDGVKSTLNSIVTNITKLQQIVAGSKEQSEYSTQVAEGLDEIIHTAQNITNTFIDTNKIISQMNEDIDKIADSLAKFKV